MIQTTPSTVATTSLTQVQQTHSGKRLSSWPLRGCFDPFTTKSTLRLPTASNGAACSIRHRRFDPTEQPSPAGLVDLMAAILAPDDQRQMGRSGALPSVIGGPGKVLNGVSGIGPAMAARIAWSVAWARAAALV
jgi:hypothetical protein